MKELNELLFRAVVLSFSALLLVLTLLCSIQLTAARDRVNRLEKDLREERAEYDRLFVRCESGQSLEEIERYAVEVLGMQHCEAGQVVYITENPDKSA